MYARQVTFSFLLLFLVGFTPTAYGQDVAALKASFEAEINALNTRNMEATLAPVDTKVVLFGIFSPFPIEGKDGYRQAIQEYFQDFEQSVLTPIDPEFRVIGTTGVAWGNFRLTTRVKNGRAESAQGRYMFTYTQGDGKWSILSMHYSLLKPLLR